MSSESERADAALRLVARFIAASTPPARVRAPRPTISQVLRSAAAASTVVLVSAGVIVAYSLLGSTSGQEAASTGAAVSSRLQPVRPAASAAVRRPVPVAVPNAPVLPAFVWRPVRKAVAYELQLFRGAERIFVARTERPRLSLPRKWTFQGREHHLRPGLYRWYVWPLRGSRLGKRAATPIVRAKLVVSG